MFVSVNLLLVRKEGEAPHVNGGRIGERLSILISNKNDCFKGTECAMRVFSMTDNEYWPGSGNCKRAICSISEGFTVEGERR